MNKPNTSGFPGMSAMTDTLDFMKNMWGGMSAPGMGIPGIIMPTLSVEEIDKQIKDLKAVESWLNVNMTMLRSTIQALEVQSATITTLQAMGQTFSDTVKPGPVAGDASAATSSRGGYSFSASAPAPDDAPGSRPVPEQSAAQQSASAANEQPEDEPAVDSAASGVKGDGSNFAAPMANPAAWWNMLQDQFKQAVGSAMASEPAAPTAPTAKKTKPASKSKPAPKAKPASKAKPTTKSKPASKSKVSAKLVPKAPGKAKAPTKT